jgi:hypothetical protein
MAPHRVATPEAEEYGQMNAKRMSHGMHNCTQPPPLNFVTLPAACLLIGEPEPDLVAGVEYTPHKPTNVGLRLRTIEVMKYDNALLRS